MADGHRLDHGLDLGLEIVRLIDHIGDVKRLALLGLGPDDLAEDAEHLVGVDAAHGQVVVAVAAVVEVESAKHLLVDQPGDDLLDVLGQVVVAGVHQHLGLRAGGFGVEEGHAPVGDVGVVEGRFKGLVLHQHGHARRHGLVHLAKAVGEALLAGPDVVLPGIVGAVGEPQREVLAARGLADGHAVQAVLDGLAADFRIAVAEAAPLVALVLKDVGVDGSDLDPVLAGQLHHALVKTIGEIPEHVHGHALADAGELVHLAGVLELLFHGPGRRRLVELAETGAGVGVAPRRCLNGEALEPGQHLVGAAPALGHLVEQSRRTIRCLGNRHGCHSRLKKPCVLVLDVPSSGPS